MSEKKIIFNGYFFSLNYIADKNNTFLAKMCNF